MFVACQAPTEGTKMGVINRILFAIGDPGATYTHVELCVTVECTDIIKSYIEKLGNRGAYARQRCRKAGARRHTHQLSVTSAQSYGPLVAMDRRYVFSPKDELYKGDYVFYRIDDIHSCSSHVERAIHTMVANGLARIDGDDLSPKPGAYNFWGGVILGHSCCVPSAFMSSLGAMEMPTHAEQMELLATHKSYFCSELVMSLMLCSPNCKGQFGSARQELGIPHPLASTPDDCAKLALAVGGVQMSLADYTAYAFTEQGLFSADDISDMNAALTQRIERNKGRR